MKTVSITLFTYTHWPHLFNSFCSLFDRPSNFVWKCFSYYHQPTRILKCQNLLQFSKFSYTFDNVKSLESQNRKPKWGVVKLLGSIIHKWRWAGKLNWRKILSVLFCLQLTTSIPTEIHYRRDGVLLILTPSDKHHFHVFPWMNGSFFYT